MNSSTPEYTLDGELHLPGQWTEPGSYREINTGRVVTLEKVDTLPASLDGQVACYVLIAHTRAQIDCQTERPTISKKPSVSP